MTPSSSALPRRRFNPNTDHYLFLLEELEDVGRTSGLADSDLAALQAVADWIETFVFGPFYEGNAGTSIYNSSFRPFQSPVPFLFVRHGVVSDWKFFLDNEEWLALWAHRFGESAVHALAEELRRLPWRARPLAQAVIDVGAN